MVETETKLRTIEVDDYYDKVHQSSWARRTAGFMAGTTLGAAYGAVIGAVAAFFPYVLGALGVAGATGAAAVVLPEIAAVAMSAALLAGVGGLMGFAANAVVGADSGAVSAGLAEKEKREKLEKMKEAGIISPSESASLQLKDNFDTNVPAPFKWRAAVITAPLAAAFGAIVGMNPVTAPAMISATGLGTLGIAAGSTAAIAASAGIVGMFGLVLAMPNSYYTNKVTNFYTKVLQGKFFGGDQKAESELSFARVPEVGNEVVIAPEMHRSQEAAPARRFTSEKTHFSFQGMVEKTEEHSNDQHPLVTR